MLPRKGWEMELGKIFRIVGNAASGITNGVLYAVGYAIGTIASETLTAVDDAIGCVDWGTDD